jgi:glycosyltransferase involved in cell wall biosynthesis
VNEARPGEVVVLLSAYNGAPYIARQIESIRAQSFRDWKLLVRDDCSADDTPKIVRSFCAADPRISLIENSGAHVGPWASFALLLSHAYHGSAEYVFLSDQDDVWLDDKMEQQLGPLRAASATGRPPRPLLVHSDLVLVDENLQRIHGSFSEFQRTSYDAADPLGTLLIHNAVVGCTIAINRPLLELALPLPPGTLHDWWLAACAAASGAIEITARPTVLYRQHSTNVVGVEHRHLFLRELARHPIEFTAKAFRSFNVGVAQARQLRDRLRSRPGIDNDVTRRVERYCDAFGDDGNVIDRLRGLNESRPKPQRTTSKIILQALAATYPFANKHL